MFGISGDLAGLPDEARSRLREHAAFWRQWRRAIRRSVAHLLNPPELKTTRDGWVAIQLNDRENGTALLFVYRLNDGAAAKRFVLRELDPTAMYELAYHVPAGKESETAGGADLMSEGVEVAIPQRYQAAVIVLRGTNHHPRKASA
jgi:hypothetical protein